MNFDNTLDGKMDTILFVLYGERLKKLKREKVMSAEEFGRYLNTECEGEPKIDKTSFFDSLHLNGYIDISDPGSVPYLTDDGSRFFRDGGYSKIASEKEVVKRGPGDMYQEIDSILLPDLDIEKYANWVLSHKSVTRNEKKKMALSLLGDKERTFSNYRFVVGEVFYKNTYWKEPTAQDIDNFPFWRKESYERELQFYHFKIDGNPLPHKMIADDVIGLIIGKLNKLHPKVLLDIFNTWLTEDYFGLAQVLGMIDAIKEIRNEVASAQNPLTKSNQDDQLPIRDKKSNSKKSNVPNSYEALFSDMTIVEKINSTLKELKAIDKEGVFILAKNKFVGFVDACIDPLKIVPHYPFHPLCECFASYYRISISKATIAEAKNTQPFHDFKQTFTATFKK